MVGNKHERVSGREMRGFGLELPELEGFTMFCLIAKELNYTRKLKRINS